MTRNKRGAKRTMGNKTEASMTMSEFAAAGFGDLEGLMNKGGEQQTATITQTADGRFIVGKFVLSPVGLELADQDVTAHEWLEFGSWLSKFQDSIQWILGDWVNVANDQSSNWGERYEDLVQQTDYSYSSLTKFAHYSRRFPFFRRRKNLTYSHHIVVVDLPESEQDEWLDHAETQGLSVRALREQMHGKNLPSRNAPIEQFNNEWTRYWKRQMRLAQRMQPHERRQMADQLRQLADQVESME